MEKIIINYTQEELEDLVGVLLDAMYLYDGVVRDVFDNFGTSEQTDQIDDRIAEINKLLAKYAPYSGQLVSPEEII